MENDRFQMGHSPGGFIAYWFSLAPVSPFDLILRIFWLLSETPTFGSTSTNADRITTHHKVKDTLL
jgi:hypothetical protein